MDLRLGLNFNSFGAYQGSGQTSAQSSGGDFKSQMESSEAQFGQDQTSLNQNLEAKNVEGQSFGKPVVSAPEFGGYVPTAPVERVLPQEEVLTTPMGLSGQKEQKVDMLTRRVAWQRFLQKMKSELDVSAEDILVAFQNLSPMELQQSPEKNIEKLVQSLDIEIEKAPVARQLFTDLIQRTGSRPLAQELKTSHQDISLSLMSQREQEQKRMSEALEKMNQKFFLNNDENKKDKDDIAAIGMGAGASASLSSNMMTEAAVQSPAVTAPAPSLGVAQVLSSGQEASPELLAQMEAVGGDSASEEYVSEEFMAQETSTPQTKQQNPSEILTQMKGAESSASQEIASNQTNTKNLSEIHQKLSQMAEGSMAPTKVVAKSAPKNSEFFSQGGETAYASSVPVESLSQAVVDKTSFSEALGAGSVTAGGALSSDQNRMSAEDLIQEARMMIHDGGGDVKVILEPEGLGEVAMKINVQGDKVNVEMITESDTAKKLLEKGMGDLKAHLQASHLNLESIKVDTASQLGQQLEQQYQDAQRNQAQQFMEQFRQGNQDFRRGFFDMPGARVYRAQTKGTAQAIEPTDGQSSSSAKQGRRLNLVA